MEKLDELALRMIAYNKNDAKRSQHLLKVRSLCRLIGAGEGMSEQELYCLEAAALVHDIGIRAAEEKFGMQNGKLQEELGPPLAEALLRELGFDEDIVKRASFLVAHHHTYSDVNDLDYRILIEADWLVNYFEYQIDSRTIYAGSDVIFKTETGRKLLSDMFGNI